MEIVRNLTWNEVLDSFKITDSDMELQKEINFLNKNYEAIKYGKNNKKLSLLSADEYNKRAMSVNERLIELGHYDEEFNIRLI